MTAKFKHLKKLEYFDFQNDRYYQINDEYQIYFDGIVYRCGCGIRSKDVPQWVFDLKDTLFNRGEK